MIHCERYIQNYTTTKRYCEMISSISNISNYIPNIGFPSPQQACRNVTKLAVPIITVMGASMISAAEAIPYVECMNDCNSYRDIHPLARLLCHTMCFLFAEKD